MGKIIETKDPIVDSILLFGWVSQQVHVFLISVIFLEWFPHENPIETLPLYLA